MSSAPSSNDPAVRMRVTPVAEIPKATGTNRRGLNRPKPQPQTTLETRLPNPLMERPMGRHVPVESRLCDEGKGVDQDRHQRGLV